MSSLQPPIQMPITSPRVGLTIPLGEGPPLMDWLGAVALARRAEEAGFDSIWLPDHFIMPVGGGRIIGGWECWTFLAGLAAVTTRIGLGTLVTSTSHRNPGVIAKMAESVDEISNGRMTLGLGCGWVQFEAEAYGFPYDHRASRFEEAVQIITGLFRDRTVTFDGTYMSAHVPTFTPNGPHPEGLPVMIAAEGPRMTRIAARYADQINLDIGKTVESLPGHRDRIDAACRDVGRDPATLRRSISVPIDLSSPSLPGDEVLKPLFDSIAHRGSAEELADILRAHAAAGFDRIQVWLNPSTTAGIDAFAPVLDLLRGS